MMVLMPSKASSWLAADPIAGGDLEPYRQRRNEPKKRGAIASAEMTFLLVLLSCVVKGVGLGLTLLSNYGVLCEVGRNSESAPGTPLAVGAMAYAEHQWAGTHHDGRVAAGTGGFHENPFRQAAVAVNLTPSARHTLWMVSNRGCASGLSAL